jgi:ribosomal protein L4
MKYNLSVLMKEAQEARKRVGNYSKEKRAELETSGRDMLKRKIGTN